MWMFKEEAVGRLPMSEESLQPDTAAATGKTELRAERKTSLVTAMRSVNNLGWSGP